jgi:glycosyltransferase involved in cell wall biosynthesis
MKVIHINTYSDFGGAGIACKRISDSINLIEPGTSQVFDKETNENNFHFFREKPFPSKITRMYFILDILSAWYRGVKKRYRFSFSLSRWGRDIEKWDLVRKADIIHLHWINQGFLSTKGLRKLGKLKKPIVWTLHDMWPLTGGCHYSGDCQHFISGCGNCYMLRNSGIRDLSHQSFLEKSLIFSQLKPFFVSPSHWLGNITRQSKLTASFPIQVIPNPIDLEFFKPGNKAAIRKKLNWVEKDFIIVINAFKITNERKGFRYMMEALNIIKERNLIPLNEICLAIIGEMDPADLVKIPVKSELLGYLKDPGRIVEINQASDIYVLPSLEDNLPNTILEAMSCGLPTVAFQIGGIPDLVDHKETGYLADPKSSASLAEGINWVYKQLKTSNALSIKARNKAMEGYSYKKIGEKYLEIYQSLKQIK